MTVFSKKEWEIYSRTRQLTFYFPLLRKALLFPNPFPPGTGK